MYSVLARFCLGMPPNEQKAMVQFTWHDGTKKNVHVEVYQLFHYQRRLADTTRLYEQRIDWLNRGSRMVFGTVIERK